MQRGEQIQLDLNLLPEKAKKELLSYYEYLLNKYKKNKKERLKKILSNPIGILPDEYRFNRNEAHER